MELACDVCGGSFTARAGARYCSGRCRTLAYRTRRDGDKPKRPRRPLGDSMWDAYVDLDKIVRRFESLVADDRFPRNREKLAWYRHSLAHSRDAIDTLLNLWPIEPSQRTEL